MSGPHATLFAPLFPAALLWSALASAQTTAPGFALERYTPPPAGSGWIVADDLAWDPGWGGAIALTTSYARNPLVITDSRSGQRLTVVADELTSNIGLSASVNRFRLSLNLAVPLWLDGWSGAPGPCPAALGLSFCAPALDPGKSPDVFSDAALGLVVRVLGEPAGHHRLALGAQLFLPSGDRGQYLTDDSYRAIVRAIYASEFDHFRFAGQFGVHLRPLDDSATPGAPRGSEFLFDEALGYALPVSAGLSTLIGVELTGATPFNAFQGGTTTANETLLTGSLETRGPGRQVRVKLGIGGGFHSDFGAPLWRAILGVELFDRGEAPHAAETDAAP